MYANKRNNLQLAALLLKHEIREVVTCPGSRNAPLVHTFAAHPDFHCYKVTDERSAGFFAIGRIMQIHRPVAVCCTSGSALLNIIPAVAEAFYQQLPLVVISADRPPQWIGQMDGQTLMQPDALASLVKKTVQLPEPTTQEEEWYCNRLINEALLALHLSGEGPVHINVPISEPLFDFSATALPDERVISHLQLTNRITATNQVERLLCEHKEKFFSAMLIVGQEAFQCLSARDLNALRAKNIVVLTEHLSNITTLDTHCITCFDAIIYAASEEEQQALVPDLLFTVGGHIVSKRLKRLLRKIQPKVHLHFSLTDQTPDLYQCLTAVVTTTTQQAIDFMASSMKCFMEDVSYLRLWEGWQEQIMKSHDSFTPQVWSDWLVFRQFFAGMPQHSALHLANSSAVRLAQFFSLPSATKVYVNRGVNGIEGSLSTAVGYAAAAQQLTFMVIGDLSFFYDQNALWNAHVNKGLRVLLVNNGGGQIFTTLPHATNSPYLHEYIAGEHSTTAQGIVEAYHCSYLLATTEEELNAALPTFFSDASERAIVLEVHTDKINNEATLQTYYKWLKTKK